MDRSKRSRWPECAEDTWYAVERSYGSFTRSFMLPEGVDEDRCEASFENGVLKVRLRKTEEEQPKRIKLLGRDKQKDKGKEEKRTKDTGTKPGEAQA